MEDIIILNKILNLVDNHNILLNENDILNLLKMTNRWPIKYFWGQPTIEIISQWGNSIINDFFTADGIFIYDRWKDYYDAGFTTIIGNVLDLTEELRILRKEIFKYTGTPINGNFYFSKGSENHRVSFDYHNHDYNVIVKMIYGKSKWKINDIEHNIEKDTTLLINKNVMHSVIECTSPKLSLTLNLI
jgi:hypothetical protein